MVLASHTHLAQEIDCSHCLQVVTPDKTEVTLEWLLTAVAYMAWISQPNGSENPEGVPFAAKQQIRQSEFSFPQYITLGNVGVVETWAPWGARKPTQVWLDV